MCKFIKGGALLLAFAMFCQFITVPASAAANLYGDLNGDNLVNAIDYANIRGYLLGINTPKGANWEDNADLDSDGQVTALDFAVFRKYLLGMISTLPINSQGGPTPTPVGDWIPFIPEPQDVKLQLVISGYPEDRSTEITATITFNNKGYRIADSGKLVCTSESGVKVFNSSGVQIEKYIGSDSVIQQTNNETIRYSVDNLGDRNHFDFIVNDTNVTAFDFTRSSIITPTPVPFGANVNQKLINANTEFATTLFKNFNKNDAKKNIVFSPYSISMALSMLYQGADSTTKSGIATALNYTDLTDDEINSSYSAHLDYFKKLYPQVELNIANSMWIRDTLDVNEAFLRQNETTFNSENAVADFDDANTPIAINKWVSDATRGKITDIVKAPMDPLLVMCLINAIYFNGSWTDQFDISNTKNSVFTNADGTKKIVPMMNKTDKYKYFQNSEVSAVELPYGSGSISMYGILPETDDIDAFIEKFDSKKWAEIKESMSTRSSIQVSIPRFKFEYEPEKLEEILGNLGMEESFNEKTADFSKIANGLFVNQIKHRAIIDVNEKGTEAAAVTYIGIATSSMPDTFIADRPFIFVIADNETGTVLFLGKVSNL